MTDKMMDLFNEENYVIQVKKLEEDKGHFTHSLYVIDKRTDEEHKTYLHEYETQNPIYNDILIMLARTIVKDGKINISVVEEFRKDRIAARLSEKMNKHISFVLQELEKGDIKVFFKREEIIDYCYENESLEDLLEFKKTILKASTRAISAFSTVADYLLVANKNMYVIEDYKKPLYIYYNQNEG